MATQILLQNAKADQQVLNVAESRIRKANDRLGKEFAKWINVVGPELLAARTVLSGVGRGNSAWADWCESLGMSKQHVNRTIKAFEVIQKVEPVGSGLPTSERQCRALSVVGEKNLAKAWELITAQSEPITATSIRSTLSSDKRFAKFFKSKPKAEPNRLARLQQMVDSLTDEERQQFIASLATKGAA